MALIKPKYITIVKSTATHPNEDIALYLARRNAGIDTLYYEKDGILDAKSKFEIIDLEKFKSLSKGTRDTHFIGLAISSNTNPLCGASVAITSKYLCDFRWSCHTGDREEQILRRIKKEISLAFDAVGEGPTPPVVQDCLSIGTKAGLYSALLIGALALEDNDYATPTNI